MIVVYPMMVSNAISENTLPALGKMLEHYIMVYMQDDVINTVNHNQPNVGKGVKIRYKIKGKKWIGESVDLVEAIPKRGDEYEKGTKKPKSSTQPKAQQALQAPKTKEKDPVDIEKHQWAKEKAAREKQKWELEKAKGQKVTLRTSDKAISIDPTYMTIETDKYGTHFIGIKVIPYRVISDAKLSHLIMHDMKIKGLTAMTIPFGRKVMGAMLRTTHRGPVTGDPKKDIIYRMTGHKGETFVVLEKNHDVDETFLQNTKRINRLFKLGWGNFILADDALGLAYFCLRANKGICQGMSYRMMYKTLGQSGVYEDIEDLRKQNSSLFKVGKRFSKLLGESKSDEKLFNYQERQ